ncbi:MAG: hypothetical protein K8R60_00150 [Burkholderiales bacterium]|nr:hypothetical protein [Burkholderiales bacterium]
MDPISSRLLVAALAAGFPLLAGAQALPDDCSSAAAPKQPVEASILGTKFTPKAVNLRSTGYVKTESEQFDSYRLELMSEDGISAPLEVGVTFIVPKGAKIEGKVFRRLATKDRSRQPMASKAGSEIEVQGWSFKNRPAKADSDHTGHLASLRLEFGQRKGDTIPGNIYLCVARGQTTMFDKTPTKEESYAVGAFVAKIDK